MNAPLILTIGLLAMRPTPAQAEQYLIGGTGILFSIRDTSSVTLNGGSVVTNNQPDDVFQF